MRPGTNTRLIQICRMRVIFYPMASLYIIFARGLARLARKAGRAGDRDTGATSEVREFRNFKPRASNFESRLRTSGLSHDSRHLRVPRLSDLKGYLGEFGL